MAGKRIGEIGDESYRAVLESMKQLNHGGAVVMRKYGVKSATDITGFGLAGHALKMAQASGVTIRLYADQVPLFEGAMDLLNLGCIPGACFRNLEFVESDTTFGAGLDYEHKMLMMDAQTSGGLLMCCDPAQVPDMLRDLSDNGFGKSSVIGEVVHFTAKHLVIEM
jgi:selenide,water dikinase